MYKDLANSLKSFSPLNMDKIINRFFEHNFVHKGDNLFGEMYEAWVYEYLMEWACNTTEVASFVLKTPNKEHYSSSEGLSNDKNGQIVYYQKSIKVAEFDGIFTYKGKIVFVESSVSTLRQYFRKLEDKLINKRELLVKHFGTEEIYYLVITRPKKRSIIYRSLPHLILYKLKSPDFGLLTQSDQALIPDCPKLKELKS